MADNCLGEGARKRMSESHKSSKMADNPRPIQIGVGADSVRGMAPALGVGSAGKILAGREMMTDPRVERQACTQAVKAVLVDSFQYAQDSLMAEMLA